MQSRFERDFTNRHAKLEQFDIDLFGLNDTLNTPLDSRTVVELPVGYGTPWARKVVGRKWVETERGDTVSGFRWKEPVILYRIWDPEIGLERKYVASIDGAKKWQAAWRRLGEKGCGLDMDGKHARAHLEGWGIDIAKASPWVNAEALGKEWESEIQRFGGYVEGVTEWSLAKQNVEELLESFRRFGSDHLGVRQSIETDGAEEGVKVEQEERPEKVKLRLGKAAHKAGTRNSRAVAVPHS